MADGNVELNIQKEHKREEIPNNNNIREFVATHMKPNRKGLWTICFRLRRGMTEEEVKKIFSQYGRVADTSLTTRYCFVRFESKESAVDALVDQKQELKVVLPEECYTYKARKEYLYDTSFRCYRNSDYYNKNQSTERSLCHKDDKLSDAGHQPNSASGRKEMKPGYYSSSQYAEDDKGLWKLHFLQKNDMTKDDYIRIFSKYGHVADIVLTSSDGHVCFRTKESAVNAYIDLKQDLGVQLPSEYQETQFFCKIHPSDQNDKQQSTSSRNNSCDSLANHQRAAPDGRNQQYTEQSVRSVIGPKDPLSNFFPCDLKFGGHVFRSVEHAYQWKKAMFYEKGRLAEEIKHAQTAEYCKKLAKELGILREWNEIKVEFMKELLLLKWEQIPAFRDELKACRGTKIVHPIPNSYWGNRRTRLGKPGRNIFGRLLEDVLKIKESPKQASTNSEEKENFSDGSADDKCMAVKAPSGDRCSKHDLCSSRIHYSENHQSAAPGRAKDMGKQLLSCTDDDNGDDTTDERVQAVVTHTVSTTNVVGPENNDTKKINTRLDRDDDQDVQTECYEENGLGMQSNSDGTHQSAAPAISTCSEKQLIDDRNKTDVPFNENPAEDSAAQDKFNGPPQMKGLFNGSHPYHMKSTGRGIIHQLSQFAENNPTVWAQVVGGGFNKLQQFSGGISSLDSHKNAAPDMVKFPEKVGTKLGSSSHTDCNKNDTIQNAGVTYSDDSNHVTTSLSYKVAPENKENLNSSCVGQIKSIGRGFMHYQIPLARMNQSCFPLGQSTRVESSGSVYETHQCAAPVVTNSLDAPQRTGQLDCSKNEKSDDKNADAKRESKDNYQAVEDTNDISKQIFRKETQKKNKLIIGSTEDHSKVNNTKAPSGGQSLKQESSSCRTSSDASHQSAAPDVTKKNNTTRRSEQLGVRSNYRKTDNEPSLEGNDDKAAAATDVAVNNGASDYQGREINEKFVSTCARGHPGQNYHREETKRSSFDYNTPHQRAAPYSQRGQDKHDDTFDMSALESDEDDTDFEEDTQMNYQRYPHPDEDHTQNQSFKNHQNHQDYGELELYELCIRNFPYNTTVKDLLKPFRLFGANGVKIINNEPGKGTLAFAQFRDYESAVSAFVTLDMTNFNGRQLHISFSWNTFCPEDTVFEKTKHLQIRTNVHGLDG